MRQMEHFEDSTHYGLTISKEDKINYYRAKFMKSLKNKPVPKTLKEAVSTLVEATPDDILERIKKEEINPTHGHFVIGRWIRNNWGLWQGGKLKEWFKEKGIRHADDMSGIILETLKREVRGQDWDVDGQVAHYRKYWEAKGINPDTIGEEDG